MMFIIIIQMYQNSPIKDQILKSYIDQIFNRYDVNSQGILNHIEMTSFFNDLFKSLGVNIIMNPQQAVQSIRAVHPLYNGTINREHLFLCFKLLMNVTNNPTPNNMPYNNYAQNMYGQPNYINYMNTNTMPNYIPPNGYMVNNNLRPQPQPMQATYNPMMNYQQQNNNQQNNNK